MSLRDFWYVVAEARELRGGAVLQRQVLDEWLVVWRDASGRAAAAQDRCKHRAGRLSFGANIDGCVRCPYHGWTYDGAGDLVAVPSEGEAFRRIEGRRLRTYQTVELDDYVYVRLSDAPGLDVGPFRLPHYRQPGYHTVRVQNRMRNNVTNCVENFIDVPHTVYVHPGIFRTERKQRIDAVVERAGGSVITTYRGETDNLGWFARLLNPRAVRIEHADEFHMPNVTHVWYRVGPRRHFLITSNSVPISDTETLVYTDLTFDFGPLSWLLKPIVRFQGQRVIDQDVEALGRQMDVIARYGAEFHNTSADVIHVLVESIRGELEQGRDPRALPDKRAEITFRV